MKNLSGCWVLCLLFGLGASAVGLVSFPAHAQDWSASEDRKAEIASRYKTLVERNPVEGLAFNKLLDYVGRGKGLDRLIKEYEGKVEGNPDAVKFHLILGHLYKARSDYNNAIEVYDRSVELAPDDPLPWMSRGLVHLALQKNEEAEADFKRSLELEKDRAKKQDILRKLADIAFSNRDWEQAQDYYDQLVELDPRNESLRMEYAQVLTQYKRYDKAVEQYDALIRLAGRDAKTRATTMRDKADLYEKMGKDEEALDLYRDAMKLVRSDNWLHRELRQRIVEVYRRADRLGELIEEYEKKWRSPNFDQSMELANLYDELGREDEALKFFRRAVRLNRRSTDARLRVIRILERRGEDKAVVRAYNQLIKVAPRQERYQFDLVRIYFRMGERKQAEQLLKQIERRFRRDADVQAALADTYMRFSMQEDALRIYQALLRLEPKNDAYILGLVEYYFQAGELDDAIETWMKLLDSSLQEGEAHARLGQVLAEHGMVDKGLTHFEKAVEISPDDIAARRGLAMAYERARRWDDAVQAWTLILEMSDQPLIANEARGRIINVYRRQNRLRSKMREFQEAFEDDPPGINEGFFLAESHLKLSNFDRAEKVYKELVDHGRRQTEESEIELEALLALEKLYQLTRSWKEAVGVLQRLAELRPDQAKDYYHRIAELSIRLYEDDQAVHFATLAVQANPDDAMAYARLGDIYEQMKNYEAASVQYQTAVDLDPRAFEIQVKLADLLMELGQTDEAESLFRQIAKKANDETLIERAALRAVDIAQVDGRLEEVEADFFPLVYRAPPKEVYRKVMLEIYERSTSPLIQRHRYGVSGDDSIDEKLREIGQRALPVLVDAVHGQNVGQRALAVRLIGDLRQGNGALAVARLVDDPDEPLRLVAAMTAAQIGDPRAAGPLVRASRDTEPAVREIAIWALGGVGGGAAVDRLVEVLQEGQSWREQALAAIALGRVGGGKATRALVEHYGQLGANRYADYIAVALVWGLGRTGDSSTVQVLGDALERGSGRVATVAAWSLASVGGQDALLKLLEINWTSSKIARRRAERGLALLGPMAHQESRRTDRFRLAEIRKEARLIDERQRNVDVEGMLDRLEQDAGLARQDEGKVNALFEMYAAGILDSARSAIDAGFAARVFADFTNELGELALGPIRATNPEGGEALLRLGSSLAEDARAAVDGGDASVEAIALIAAVGLEGDRDRLKRWAEHDDPAVRIMAIRGLAAFESEDVETVLVKALDDPRFEIRVEAARSLGTVFRESKAPAVASALSAKLDDEFDSVGSVVAWALGQVGLSSSVKPLAEALSSSKVPVQISILEALREIDTPAARRVLERYARHVDPRIRKAALR